MMLSEVGVREFGIQGKTIKSQKGRIEVLTSKLDTLSSSLTTARQRYRHAALLLS